MCYFKRMISKDTRRFLALALFPLLLLGVSAANAEVVATVVFATGGAGIVAADGVARRAERGGEVQAGESIDTADGKVQMRFLDGATMALRSDTRFRVDQYRFVEQGGKVGPESRSIFSLLKGGFRTITGLIGKHDTRQYRVDTVVATIGIRGTDYSAQLRPDGLSVSTHAGLVEVCNDTGCIQVAAGQAAMVRDKSSQPRLSGGASGDAAGSGVVTPGNAVPELPAPQISPQEFHVPQVVPQEILVPQHGTPGGVSPSAPGRTAN